MTPLSEYLSHAILYAISSDYRRNARAQKALRNPKKTVEDKAEDKSEDKLPDAEEISNLIYIQHQADS